MVARGVDGALAGFVGEADAEVGDGEGGAVVGAGVLGLGTEEVGAEEEGSQGQEREPEGEGQREHGWWRSAAASRRAAWTERDSPGCQSVVTGETHQVSAPPGTGV